MKKILICAYAQKNLGDDLLVSMLCNRYKNCKFYLNSTLKYNNKVLSKYNNLKISNFIFVKICNYIVRKLNILKYLPDNFTKKKCDLMARIGGSIFMQDEPMDKIREREKSIYFTNMIDYFILDSNFGPYMDQEYFDIIASVVTASRDTCFRDNYSYELFNYLPNVRENPDIVFSYDVSKYKGISKKRVVISVIDLDLTCRNELIKYKDEYEEYLKQMSEDFIKKGYTISLMSFCKKEGDERCVKSIYNKISDELKEKVDIYNYRGNIQEAIENMANSEIIVGTRFHAIVIGLILNKNVIPIIYSDKTKNVLNDIEFMGSRIDIKDLKATDFRNLDLNYKLDITNISKDAQLQFSKLDEFLNEELQED